MSPVLDQADVILCQMDQPSGKITQKSSDRIRHESQQELQLNLLDSVGPNQQAANLHNAGSSQQLKWVPLDDRREQLDLIGTNLHGSLQQQQQDSDRLVRPPKRPKLEPGEPLNVSSVEPQCQVLMRAERQVGAPPIASNENNPSQAREIQCDRTPLGYCQHDMNQLGQVGFLQQRVECPPLTEIEGLSQTGEIGTEEDEEEDECESEGLNYGPILGTIIDGKKLALLMQPSVAAFLRNIQFQLQRNITTG